MRLCYIIRGLPGSGKTTLAREISKGYQLNRIQTFICSTDYYWGTPYKFVPSKLGEAHAWCFSEFKTAIDNKFQVVIVDNTNTCKWEFEKYADYACEANYIVQLAEPQTHWKFNAEELTGKNTHGVPAKTINKMLDRWESSEDLVAADERLSIYRPDQII